MYIVAVTGLCRRINFIPQIPCFSKTILTSNSIDFFPSPPNNFLLVPTSSEIWNCRQSTIYSIVNVIHIVWLCPEAGTFEILVANHSPIRYLI